MTNGYPEGTATRADNGGQPSRLERETTSLGTQYHQVNTSRVRQSNLICAGRCCSCTTQSTCKQAARCECRQAGRPCFDCNCYSKCSNKNGEDPLCIVIDPSNREDVNARVHAIAGPTPSEESDAGATIDGDESMEANEEESTGISDPAGEVEEMYLNEGDLPGTIISEADKKLHEVFGDHTHQNDGSHLTGGVADDAKWQSWWKKLVVYPSAMYRVPDGAAGKRFIRALDKELKGIKSRNWNSERVTIFTMVILQKNREVKRAKDIKNRISHRLDSWERGDYDMLVQTTERDMQTFLRANQGTTTSEQRYKIFNNIAMSKGTRAALNYIANSEKGGVLMPDDIDEKTGMLVKDALEAKHPDSRDPDVSHWEEYDETPAFIDIDITEDTVEEVSRHLSGGAGLNGTDSQEMSRWLTCYGPASRELRQTVAELANWLANNTPPWAAYRAFMSGRLIALDKCPGIRPIGIGEIWRRLFAKCLLKVTGAEATEACGTDQLCAGLKSGIEGGVHAMQEVWDEHRMEEEWGVLLIDASNAFNEKERKGMLWTVRHEWPSGARFLFNVYRHHSALVIRNNNGIGAFILSKEGVTQGCPLAMFGYGLGVLSPHPTA